MVLASERFAEGGGNHDARGEVGIAEDVETVRSIVLLAWYRGIPTSTCMIVHLYTNILWYTSNM